MLGLTFKESGTSLEDIISALTVELEKLSGRSFDRQASGDGAAASKSSSRDRAEPRPERRGVPPGRKTLTASRIEQSIVDAGLKRRRGRRDRRGGRYGKGRRTSRAASGGPGQVETGAAASAVIESLAANLAGGFEATGFEVTGASKSAGISEALSRAV